MSEGRGAEREPGAADGSRSGIGDGPPPGTRTVVGYGPEGEPRARIRQGTQAQVGPVRIGVLAARRHDPEQGGEVFARLQLGDSVGVETVEVSEGDGVAVGAEGVLNIVRIIPQDPTRSGPAIPASARGVIFVELVAAGDRSEDHPRGDG